MEQEIKYGKLVNSVLEYAPKVIKWHEHYVSNPSSDKLLELGFLPVIKTEKPTDDIPEGKYYDSHYEENTDKTEIVQVWELKDIPMDVWISADEALEIISGSTTTTRNGAKQLRALLELQTESLTDQQALNVATYVKRWQEGVEYVCNAEKVDRVSVVDDDNGIVLYKCLQTHVSQITHKPSPDTSALWQRIDEEHLGTIDDPIPFHVNMELFKDKYYTEDGVLYLCVLSSGIAVHNYLKDLVPLYVTVVG